MSVNYSLASNTFVSIMKKQRINNELLARIVKRIKQLREEKKISQETFYIDTDIHIARIETGRINITVSTLSSICSYLGVSLADFFSEME